MSNPTPHPYYLTRPDRTTGERLDDIEQKVIATYARTVRIESRLTAFLVQSGLSAEGTAPPPLPSKDTKQ